jgi:hypothetical protein
MVSGYDKNPPPEGPYTPDVGLVGRLILLTLAIFVLFVGFGWIFV